MSALGQSSYHPPLVAERRHSERTRISENIAVLIGRGKGVMINLSKRGMRIRHSVQAQRDSNVRISFEWKGQRLASTAEVLASRVVALGDGNRPTMYESRLRFRHLSEAAGELLQRVCAAVQNDDVRKWVANLRGWIDEVSTSTPAHVSTGTYLRCRLLPRGWERKWVRDHSQPGDGFALPETIDAREIDTLCDTYQRLDDDGRQLIRLFASAAVT